MHPTPQSGALRATPAQQFASDNNAGLCPVALEALIAANGAHATGYGGEPWTQSAVAAIREFLAAPEAQVFFVFNGTAANALVLAHICRSWNAVIAHASSHIEMDEAGAVSFFSGGATLMTADPPDAKLTPACVERLARKFQGVHHVAPAALSLTQSTELGTVYRLEELAALTAVARANGLRVHMDGARFANALARLGCSPADASWRAGVDVLCMGGVKNGLGVGEAVVFFDALLARDFDRRLKQAGQLNSKMRLVTAPWEAMIRTGTYLANARHANAMADRLAAQIAGLPDARLMAPVQANAVFIELPPAMQAHLRAAGWQFYTFIGERGCRLMCAWDTAPETVDRFAADVRASPQA